MKVGNITAENSLMNLTQNITPNASTEVNFDQCMQQTMDQRSDMAAKPEAVKIKDGVAVVENTNPAASSEAETASVVVTDTVQAEAGEAVMDVTPEQLEKINQLVKDAVKEILGLDDAAIEAILTELGMAPLDLLQPENLQQFVLLADGGQEPTDLLFNEQMMADFRMLSEALQNLDISGITDLSVQQVEMAVHAFDGMQEQPQEQKLLAGLNPEIPVQAEESTEVENEFVQDNRTVITLQGRNAQTVNQETTVTGEAVSASESRQEGVVVSVVSENEADASGQNQMAKQEQSGELWNEGLPMSRPQEQTREIPLVVNQFQQALHAVKESSVPQPITPQMVQIVEQIVEQIRMNFHADTTSMEMQLNPESLGRVLLTVTAKAGVMTANFTVQTEEAKAALESQMYTLRENLEQKELKVDAVEVTVSNFDFTHAGGDEDSKNMDQGDGRSRRFRMEEQEGEETDELTAEEEAERVRRNVMRDNGGSIDFTA